MKIQLNELTEWAHFRGVVNGQTVIGRKLNDRIAICQNYTSNDKDYTVPVEFGLEYAFIRSLNADEILNLKKSGWFNERFYKIYEEYENRLKQQAA